LDVLLGDPDDKVLVVDLSGVTFLASSGLAVLIRAAHRAATRDLRLQLVAATRAVRRPLEITGVDRMFDLHPDVESACHPD
jgi:anti-sigma B factor antagonist